jgi:hypothetical protein
VNNTKLCHNYRIKKREEKAAIKGKESHHEMLMHQNKLHRQEAKRYQNEADALKLKAFPDKILGEFSKGGRLWMADKYAKVPIMLQALATELRHADPDLVASVLN